MSRGRLTLLACILSSSLVGMDSSMTAAALPAIAEDLNAGLAVQQWVVAGFLLALGSLLLVGGALGDVYGQWRIFGIGTAGFAVASLVSAVAWSAPLLIAGRLLQGTTAALMVPGALAVITTTFDGARRSKAIGTWAAWSSLSVVVSPVLGGLLVDALSWRVIYAALVPLGALVVVLILRAAPPRERGAPTGRVDRAGALLGVPLVGGPVFALIQGPEAGWGHPLVLAGMAAGVVSAIAFVWWERRAPNPLLPLDLFRNRAFTTLNIVTFLLYGALISSGVYAILFLQETAGYSPSQAGLAGATVVMAVLFVLSGRFGALADRYGPRLFVGGGALVVGGAVLLLLRTDADADFFTVFLPWGLLHGIGLSMLVAPLTAGVLAAAGEGRAGVASGINNAVARIGSLLWIVVIGVLISVQFSSSLERSLEGQPLSATASAGVEAAKTRPFDTTPPEGLAPAERGLLEDALQEAALDAFRLCVVVIAGLAIVSGVLAIVGLRVRQRLIEAARCPYGSMAGMPQDLVESR